jgi:cell division septation protein DedD
MVAVGDRVQVPSKRVGQAPRDGVVTSVSGSLLRVTWSGGEESAIFPSMGSLVVVGKVRARSKKAAATARKAVSKKALAKKAVSKKAAKKVAKAPTPKAAKKATKKSAKPTRPQATKSSSKHSGRAGKRRK